MSQGLAGVPFPSAAVMAAHRPCPQLPTVPSPLHTLELLPCPAPLAPHLVVVGTEVFEVSEADVAEADDNGDDQDDECEHGRGG